MRLKCPVVALATVGLVLIFVNPVCATPVDLGPGRIWVVNLPVLFVNYVRTTPVDLETWYAFEWSGFVALDGWLEATGSSYYVWAGLEDPGVSPWTFTAPPEGVCFTVTDMETDVDSFAIKDYGVLVGTTPDTGPWDSHDPCYFDPWGCMDSDFSHGTFYFGAGEHLITIENKDPRGVTGRGAFRLDAVSGPVDGSTGKVITFIPLILHGSLYMPYQIAVDEKQNLIYVGAEAQAIPDQVKSADGKSPCKAIHEAPDD